MIEHSGVLVILTQKKLATELPETQAKVTYLDERWDESSQNGLKFEPVFYQRVKLLAIMAEAFAKGHSLEEHKQEALEKNLNKICETITFSKTISDMQFLKVA